MKTLIIISIIILSMIICFLILCANCIYISKKLEKFTSKLPPLHKNNKLDLPVYYINLDRSKKRNENMIKQLNDLEIKDYKRISAVEGRKLNIKKDKIKIHNKEIKFINNNIKLKSSNIGCLLSHIKTIMTAYKNNENMCIIFEDDTLLDLIPIWGKKITEVVNDFPFDWECINLSNLWNYTSLYIPFYKLDNNKIIRWDKGMGNAGHYIINKKGMKKIYEKFKDGIIIPNYIKINNKKSPPVSDIWIYHLLNTYVYNGKPLFFAGEYITSRFKSISLFDLFTWKKYFRHIYNSYSEKDIKEAWKEYYKNK